MAIIDKLELKGKQCLIEIEKIVERKVVDLLTIEWLSHSTQINALPDILREGILSSGFARRIKKNNYRRSYNFPELYYYVSTLDGQHVISSIQKGLLPRLGDVHILTNRIKCIPAGEIFDDEAPYTPVPGEILVRDRISPRVFLGIAIRQSTNPELVLNIARKVWVDRPEYAVPIYCLNVKQGRIDLLWPLNTFKPPVKAAGHGSS